MKDENYIREENVSFENEDYKPEILTKTQCRNLGGVDGELISATRYTRKSAKGADYLQYDLLVRVDAFTEITVPFVFRENMKWKKVQPKQIRIKVIEDAKNKDYLQWEITSLDPKN